MGTSKEESPKYGRPFWRTLRGVPNVHTPYFFCLNFSFLAFANKVQGIGIGKFPNSKSFLFQMSEIQTFEVLGQSDFLTYH